MLSRRNILTTAAAGALSAAAARAATFGDPDQPAEGAVNVSDSTALTDPRGPRTRALQATSRYSKTRRQPTSTA